MRIACVEIANFRKLKAVRLELSPTTTLLVGANNSGKTTAMEALRQFLKREAFKITDFTLSDLITIKEIGDVWERESGHAEPSDQHARWDQVLPRLDIWFEAAESELYRVPDLLPILDDYCGGVGVRLQLEPKNMDGLRKAYLAKRAAVEATLEGETPGSLNLWPAHLVDYLRTEIGGGFEVVPYKLDPALLCGEVKFGENVVGQPRPVDKPREVVLQPVDPFEERLTGNPLRHLVQVDVVNAQRGLGADDSAPGKLSQQVATYYSKHLDFARKPDKADIDAIRATQEASQAFDQRLDHAFKEPLAEIANMGYPGGNNPNVVIKTVMKLLDGLKHDSALMYRVRKSDGDGIALELPEGLNGLGYQNLVLMIFSLMLYRDARLRVGKAWMDDSGEQAPLVPLHLVLVEEPEAHLHAQVQRVFIKQAYGTLAKRPEDRLDYEDLATQLVVSTHSSHIAHEVDFRHIRYFRRCLDAPESDVPISVVKWNAPGVVDTLFVRSCHPGQSVLPLPLRWADSAEAGVSPVGVVPPFDELENLAA